MRDDAGVYAGAYAGAYAEACAEAHAGGGLEKAHAVK